MFALRLLNAAILAATAQLCLAETTATETATTSSSTAATTQTLRRTYDQVAPDEDATSESLSTASALSSDTERLNWLASAAVADDFRESSSVKFQNYSGLIPGDADGDTEHKKDFTPTPELFSGEITRQPAGPLTGRIIYCSAGHGWTNDNTSTTLWYTQRPATHYVVEDMGNLDQMNLYADLCWRAGATIVPMRPIGFQHVERVIDNQSGQALFHGEWADSDSTASFHFAGATIPYRFARAATRESAVARFQPVIPVTDTYPVYTWVRPGADRVKQTYRVAHAGGVTEVDVDHRKVGSGWVYLGSFVFRGGSKGYVEVTNAVRDAADAAAGGVVIADAVRFGNGMGDTNRGGGISTKPREEEASRYWVERSITEGVPPIYDAFREREDQSNNVGAAPRFAAHMNREAAGDFFDRVFISFHSNAVGGRGVVGLFNSHAIMRPDHQIELAKLTADELNAEMTSGGLQLPEPWFVRKVRTDGHINFGEIRRDYLNNEMSATIVEVAYHDNAQDAALLRRLSIRQAIALSAYRATLRYFGEVGKKDVPLYSPPLAPIIVEARQADTSGTAVIRWQPSSQDSLSSPAKDIRYRLYQSDDGVVFDGGRDVGAATEYTVKKLKEHAPVYFRVTAVSAGGESLPSQVLGLARSAGPRVLVVQASKGALDDAPMIQHAEANLGWATRPGGEFVRLVPRVMNNGEQVRAVGDGAGRLKLGFDSITIDALTSDTAQALNYKALAIMLGRAPVSEDLATSEALLALHDYVTSGGALLINGACLAECDGVTTDGLARWGEFSRTVLQTGYRPQTSATGVIKSGDRDLTTVTLQIGNRGQRYFVARNNEVLAPEENGRAVLAYQDEQGVAAVASLKDRHIRTALIGFPIEELDSREEQGVLMGQILLAMGLDEHTKAAAEVKDPKETAASKDEQTTKTVVISEAKDKDKPQKTKD